jgi:hypothetical protein
VLPPDDGADQCRRLGLPSVHASPPNAEGASRLPRASESIHEALVVGRPAVTDAALDRRTPPTEALESVHHPAYVALVELACQQG